MVERKAEWFVNRVPDLQPKPGLPQKAATLIAEAGPLDAPHGLDEANLQPVAKGPVTPLETALKTAVSAAAEAEKHGAKIGYAVRFRPEDIRVARNHGPDRNAIGAGGGNDPVLVALISASGSVAVAVTALILNYRLFNSLERRIEIIEADLKQFFRDLAEHDKRIARLEN